MIAVKSTNITSPLGFTTGQNYLSVKAGQSALRRYDNWKGILSQSVTLSAFSDEQKAALHIDGYTLLESMAIRSIEDALARTDIDVSSPRTIFILSTTKCNIDELSADAAQVGDYSDPGVSARKIAGYFGFVSDPVVVCNACISGITAQILSDRLISAGYYDNAVVCGADILSVFTVSGFLSFKSLSPSECRPFDIERSGLNLGEAAATMVLGRVDACPDDVPSGWKLTAGALNNDAYHISAPSPSGDGAFRAIQSVLGMTSIEDLAFVSAHGTATMFNDQMESKAIERAGLSSVPVSALKGYYGHTLGASGVLETIISICSLSEGVVLPVRGFKEIGVSGRINVAVDMSRTDKGAFLKIISGFGGCNGAALYANGNIKSGNLYEDVPHAALHTVHLTQSSLEVDGRPMEIEQTGKELLNEIYRKYISDYPKFHKMDMLSKLVFAATELLVAGEPPSRKDSDRAVVLFNASSSILTDRQHLLTISDKDDFFPSPSVFVYTLPNISVGEVAIKHSYRGETSLYILDSRNEELMSRIVEASLRCPQIRSMVTGWVDCSGEDVFEADLKLLMK